MLKRYRRQFILLELSLIGSVLALVLILVGVYMYHDYREELKNTMDEVVRPLRSSMFYGFEMERPPWEEAPDGPGRAPDDAGGPGSRKGIDTVFYMPGSGQIAVLSDDPLFDAETIAEAIPAIVRLEESFGTLREYGMIYYRSGGGGIYKIAIASTSYLRQSMTDLTLILAGIFFASMVLFYFISRRISLLAIRPLEEAMVREKQFVADASHDLKTPLTVILANSSILQSNPQSTVGQQMKWIDSTVSAAHNMRSMVNSLLTLSGVEASESTIELERVNLSDAAEQAILQMEGVAYDSGIELESEIESGIYIRGSRDYALQIVSSLIENALKYEPRHGSVSVRLRSERGQAVLTVANPNSVIAPEDLPHIFDRFYRADKTRDARGGHGLGLAIAKRMTEAMGAKISAASSDKAGTCFTVTYEIF